MAVKYTSDQQRVIDERGANILVSAAAGSGKTAVLVERILKIITDKEHPVDIDRLLVVTFTNAAAAEMRERIHDAILRKLQDTPEDTNLAKQAILVHHAQITTIDSFCRFILMNHFQEIGLDPGFSVGDPGQMQLLAKDTMERVMERACAKTTWYEGSDEDFINLCDVFAKKGRDDMVMNLAERLYQFVMSLPWPEKWLREALQDYEAATLEEFLMLPFIQEGERNARRLLQELVDSYTKGIEICQEGAGPEAYIPLFEAERQSLADSLNTNSYEALAQAVLSITFDRLPTVRKGTADDEKKLQAKNIRDEAKKQVGNLKDTFFFEDVALMWEDMQAAGRILRPLIYLTLDFMREFAAKKEKEGLIDFHDMEHFALKILVDADGAPTGTARLYQDFYEQIMIDEYQDSNEVQELLLSVISREWGERPNRFMVGDMKQSIYKFRMARPEIFLEKYARYQADKKQNVRIDLKQNFRSRAQVVDFVNAVFYPLMCQEVGGITYDDNAALYVGAEYPEAADGKQDYFRPELLIFEKKKEQTNTSEELSNQEGEARMIGKRIKELMKDGLVADGAGGLRDVHYSDMVVLVRSTTGLMEELQKVLVREGIPASIPSRTGYFSANEVQILLKLIEVIVNPNQDIALAAVLKSPFGGFDDNELACIGAIRKEEQESLSFYEKLCLWGTEKGNAFVEKLDRYRALSKTEAVHDLLYEILRENRYLDYVTALPAGAIRKANVEMLLQKALEYENSQMHGLFGFLRYMKQLEKYEVDYGEGSEENGDSVRIMTIHKSKGLEFPICFVAGLSKRFNRRDLTGSMLLDTDMGVGMEYRNLDTRVIRRTIKQKIVADKMKRDETGEELRVLYVAMTRAKEKLILTGTLDDVEKVQEDCRAGNLGELEKAVQERKVRSGAILGASGFMRMIMEVLSLYGDCEEKLPQMKIYHEDDLQIADAVQSLQREGGRKLLLQSLQQSGNTVPTSEIAMELSKRIHFPYPHENLKGLYTKTSVSELKLAALHEDEQTQVIFETEREEAVVPEFRKEKKEAGGATRGSAYHRLLELLDFEKFLSCENREQLLKELRVQEAAILTERTMSQQEIALVSEEKILSFLQSDAAVDMGKAAEKGMLFKEQPFVMELPARRVNPDFPKEETVLIQGIIDVYYIRDGKVTLLDYKTDRVAKKEDLIKRYQTQLDYYKEALERLTGQEVAEVLIYSFAFSKSLAI